MQWSIFAPRTTPQKEVQIDGIKFTAATQGKSVPKVAEGWHHLNLLPSPCDFCHWLSTGLVSPIHRLPLNEGLGFRVPDITLHLFRTRLKQATQRLDFVLTPQRAKGFWGDTWNISSPTPRVSIWCNMIHITLNSRYSRRGGHWRSGAYLAIHNFSFTKLCLKMSSAKWTPFCSVGLGGDMS